MKRQFSRRALRAGLLIAALSGACSTDQTQADRPATDTTSTAHADSTVSLGPDAVASAEIATTLARADDPRTDMGGRALEVPGHVELDPRRVAVLAARMSGRLERLDVVLGDEVLSGQVVGALFGTSYLTAQADLQQAARRESLLAGTADSANARVLAEAAQRRLRLLGESEEALLALRRGSPPHDLLVLRAPRAGSVIEATVMPGQSVPDGEALLTIADLTELDVVAEVPEVSLPALRIGQRADVSVPAFPGRQYTGSVERMHDVLDPETRTIRAVLHVHNPDRSLRPGMYATVRLHLPIDPVAGRGGALIPRSALVSDGTAMIVFVQTAEGEYVRRVVEWESLSPVGSMRADQPMVRVRTGVAVGDRIVVRGAFLLKSELGKSERGEHE